MYPPSILIDQVESIIGGLFGVRYGGNSDSTSDEAKEFGMMHRVYVLYIPMNG